MERNPRLTRLCLTGAVIAALVWGCIHWIRTDPVIRSKLAIRVSRWLEEPEPAGDKVRHHMPMLSDHQMASDDQAFSEQQRFEALAPGDPQRLESFKSLAGSVELAAEDLLSMANTFSGGARLMALVSLADSCVRGNPDLYFQILDGMSPGSARNQVIGCGAYSLDSENLNHLIDRISSESNQDEIETLAADLRNRESPKSSAADALLEMAAKQGRPELASALAFAAGQQSVRKTESASLDRFSLEIRQSFHEGRLKRMLDDHDPAFGANLASADIISAARKELVQEWAGIQTRSLDVDRAIQQGRVLAEPDFETYCAAVARTLVHMSPKETEAEISRLPLGKFRDLMIAELVAYFEKSGDAAEADRWKKRKFASPTK